ncbi:MAG: DUF5684 domain-containing protein [Thermodesulfovibrionales bacterium]
MKKIAFFILLSFSLLMSSDVVAKPDTEYEKAMQYYNKGNYKEAATLLKNYVKLRPDPVAYYRTGYALYKLKQFDEANEYFKQAYIIDPSFSPQAGVIKEQPQERPQKTKKPSAKHGTSPKESLVAPIEKKRPEAAKEPDVQRQPAHEVQPQPPIHEPSVTIPPGHEPPLSEPQRVDPGKGIQAPPAFSGFPETQKPMTFPAPTMLPGLLAGFAALIIILEIAFYIYFCLCIFLIAKKLDVPNPWIAWIPIVQIWTIVNCAGKPWWWILLLLVPVVNIIIGIILWMSITENLGKNKWLGLLMLLPIINFIYMGILAFSKGEKHVSMPEDATPA